MPILYILSLPHPRQKKDFCHLPLKGVIYKHDFLILKEKFKHQTVILLHNLPSLITVWLPCRGIYPWYQSIIFTWTYDPFPDFARIIPPPSLSARDEGVISKPMHMSIETYQIILLSFRQQNPAHIHVWPTRHIAATRHPGFEQQNMTSSRCMSVSSLHGRSTDRKSSADIHGTGGSMALRDKWPI